MIICSYHTRKSLYVFRVTRRYQLLYGLYLIQIHLDSLVGDQIPQEFFSAYTKRTFISIEAKFLPSKDPKYLSQIRHMLLLLSFYHHIIDINLNYASDLILEHSYYHSLVGGPHILQLKGHHRLMIVPFGGYK